jgi:hypothetical protein
MIEKRHVHPRRGNKYIVQCVWVRLGDEIAEEMPADTVLREHTDDHLCGAEDHAHKSVQPPNFPRRRSWSCRHREPPRNPIASSENLPLPTRVQVLARALVVAIVEIQP